MSLNVSEIKQKILNYIREKGPSLPVHLTKVSNLNLTFTSAILSELFREKSLKISNLKVGSSSLYFLQGQEEMLENFVSNLKGPEIDAFRRLKENRILDDEKQTPVMRVALRSIRDFAIPLKSREKIFWKYHLVSDEKAIEAIGDSRDTTVVSQERIIGQQIWDDIKKENVRKEDFLEAIKKHVEEIMNKESDNSKENPPPISSESLDTEQAQPEEIAPEIDSSTLEGILPKEEEKIDSQKEDIAPEQIVETIIVKKPIRKTSKKEIFVNFVSESLEKIGIREVTFLKKDLKKIILFSEGYIILAYDKKKLDENELLKDIKRFAGDKKVKIFFKGKPPEKLIEKRNLLSSIQEISKFEEQ